MPEDPESVAIPAYSIAPGVCTAPGACYLTLRRFAGRDCIQRHSLMRPFVALGGTQRPRPSAPFRKSQFTAWIGMASQRLAAIAAFTLTSCLMAQQKASPNNPRFGTLANSSIQELISPKANTAVGTCLSHLSTEEKLHIFLLRFMLLHFVLKSCDKAAIAGIVFCNNPAKICFQMLPCTIPTYSH